MVEQTRANFNTATKKQLEFFSDFTVDFTPHPVTEELSRLTNENAVKRSIRNIIMTNKNERPFMPTFGGDLNKLLFEPMSPSTSINIQNAINDAIINFEPRAKLSNIEVIPDEVNNSYRVNIFFMVVNSKNPVGMTVFLQRVR